jgi:tetratricopeptide (TPR) repeat protein
MKKVVLLFVVVSVSLMAFAQDQDPGELVKKANAAVEAKDYQKAIELFEAVLAIPDNGQDEANINSVLKQLKPAVAKDNAAAAIDNEEYEKAVELYKKAAADYPDAGITEQAGKMFYNAGIKNYKASEFLEAAGCFSTAENEFGYEKAEKYKTASLKKVAEGLAAEGKGSVEGVNVSPENKELLIKSLAKEYFDKGYELYKDGAAAIKQAGDEVNNGNMTTLDDAYINAVAGGKKKLEQAIPLLKKALSLDPENKNAQNVLDACEQSV